MGTIQNFEKDDEEQKNYDKYFNDKAIFGSKDIVS